jgi:hypothetical protein
MPCPLNLSPMTRRLKPRSDRKASGSRCARVRNRTLNVAYSTAEQRALSFRVNGGTAATVNLGATGGYDIPGNQSFTVSLKAGANTIQFFNASGWAPDIDKITVQQ